MILFQFVIPGTFWKLNDSLFPTGTFVGFHLSFCWCKGQGSTKQKTLLLVHFQKQSRMHVMRNPRICVVNFVMSPVTEQVTNFFYFQIFCWGWCFLMYFLQFHRDSITPNPNLSLLFFVSPDVFCLCKKYGSGFQKKLPLKSSKKTEKKQKNIHGTHKNHIWHMANLGCPPFPVIVGGKMKV